MKKLSLFLLTFIMLLCVSASCFANQPYKHPDYNLRTVKEIHITQIDNLEGEPTRRFKIDENAETKVLAAILQAAGKQKLIATDETQKPLLEYHNVKASQKNLAPRDLEMRITVNHCGYSVVAVPGHFEDYTTQERHYYYDKDGKRHYWTEDVVRQRWVPESFHPYAQLSLIYNFYDLSDGTLVASFSDSRSREYENDPADGMLNRSLKDCFNKIFRK
ncbi:hypothetical protein [Phascolarctobacterium succinatutens]|uniref:hypothetical protein n=1 Tax=Phascolarctobacterium succinatutens TaxID=626940 RepID=UPI00402943F6